MEEQNRFIPLAKDTETRTPSPGTKNNKFVSGLKFSSINVNGIRSKKLGLLAYLDFHQPQFKEQNMTALYQLQNCFRKLVHTMYTERIDTLKVVV